MGLRIENNSYEYQRIIAEKNKETTFGGQGREEITIDLNAKKTNKVKEIEVNNRLIQPKSNKNSPRKAGNDIEDHKRDI
jgi:hypothetical protein